LPLHQIGNGSSWRLLRQEVAATADPHELEDIGCIDNLTNENKDF
jgi:hypothetical protein